MVTNKTSMPTQGKIVKTTLKHIHTVITTTTMLLFKEGKAAKYD